MFSSVKKYFLVKTYSFIFIQEIQLYSENLVLLGRSESEHALIGGKVAVEFADEALILERMDAEHGPVEASLLPRRCCVGVLGCRCRRRRADETVEQIACECALIEEKRVLERLVAQHVHVDHIGATLRLLERLLLSLELVEVGHEGFHRLDEYELGRLLLMLLLLLLLLQFVDELSREDAAARLQLNNGVIVTGWPCLAIVVVVVVVEYVLGYAVGERRVEET